MQWKSGDARGGSPLTGVWGCAPVFPSPLAAAGGRTNEVARGLAQAITKTIQGNAEFFFLVYVLSIEDVKEMDNWLGVNNQIFIYAHKA
ncbi:MAG TPA: hypothetical protein VN729_01600 [Ktedonobacteraceae bacterium]|nr:hypothetical protein [Ktedonobacteraceae bacterium]